MSNAMHTSRPGYTAARATPVLVGRAEQLARIDDAVRDVGHTRVLLIAGEGGIGKTRLVDEVLGHYRGKSGLVVAREPVDLYHIATHSVEGLMAAIQRALDPDATGFAGYLSAQRELSRHLAEPTGTAARLRELRQELEDAFLADLGRLTAGGDRLILVLDTAEKLVYEITDVERALDLTQERIATWNWLCKVLLPGVGNAVVLIAGRPAALQLAADLQQIGGIKYEAIELQGLSEQEALDYFAAVADAAEQVGDTATAARVRAVPEATRRTLARKTGGRPILLALAIDYLVIAGFLPDLDALDAAALETELVRAIQETNRPADDAIRALAWARKGMDAELLARVAGLGSEEAGWDTAQAERWLEELRRLSFVKVRPADQRVFLHDEMYDLLERHVLRPWQYPGRARGVYHTILDCYKVRLERTREELAATYQELGWAGGDSPEAVEAEHKTLRHIAEISHRLQEALVEDLHYQLRADAREGFEAYYRYAEEAVLGENESLDMQLRAELLAFLAERDPSGRAAAVDGLRRSSVNADAAVRWIKRFVAAERYADATALAEKIHRSRLLPSDDRLANGELTTWVALAQLYGGLVSFEVIEQALLPAITELERLPVTWRRCAVLARAYNNLGYLYRLQGRYYGARNAYARAVPLWRAVKIEAEHANTLNNLAFARAEVGDFGTGRRQVEDALEMRQKAGARPQIGLSLNTLAHIAIRSELYITARYNAQRALEMFKAAQDARGCGLALVALAEAKRRFASEGPCPDVEADKLLEEAVEHAREGVEILEAVKEPSRLVEALIELGCTYRDRMKLWRRYRQEEVEKLAEKGVSALRQARDLAAGQGITYRQADALINQAWLHYYLEGYYKFVAKQPDKAAEELNKIEGCLSAVIGRDGRNGLIPPHYFITEHGVPELDKERLIVPMLAQLGKAHLLRGQVAFNRFRDGEADALPEAIELYTLSLAYDNRVSEQQFRDKRRGKDRIYERLKKLNPEEWQIVYQAVTDTEKKYHLGHSEMRRFLEDNFGPPESLRPLEF